MLTHYIKNKIKPIQQMLAVGKETFFLRTRVCCKCEICIHNLWFGSGCHWVFPDISGLLLISAFIRFGLALSVTCGWHKHRLPVTSDFRFRLCGCYTWPVRFSAVDTQHLKDIWQFSRCFKWLLQSTQMLLDPCKIYFEVIIYNLCVVCLITEIEAHPVHLASCGYLVS